MNTRNISPNDKILETSKFAIMVSDLEALEIVMDYYGNVQNFVDLINPNQNFRMQLTGFGYSDARVTLTDLLPMNEKMLQTVLAVHRKTLAVESHSLQYVQNYPVLVYIEQLPDTRSTGLVRLFLSSRTYDCVKSNSCDPSLSNATVSMNNHSGTPRIYLSSSLFSKEFFASNRKLLLSHFTLGEDFPYYAAEMMPAIVCPVWPDFITKEWMQRERPSLWLSLATIEEISRTEILLVPCSYTALPQSYEHSWSFRFYAAEKYIWSQATTVQKIAYNISLKEILLLIGCKFDRYLYNIFNSCVLWTFDEYTVSMNDIIGGVLKIVYKFQQCLLKRHCSNYFIPNVNLLSDHSQEFCDNIAEQTLQQLLNEINAASDRWQAEKMSTISLSNEQKVWLHLQQNEEHVCGNEDSSFECTTDTEKCLRYIAEISLKRTARILFLQLHVGLRQSRTLANAIKEHTRALEVISKLPFQMELKSPIRHFLLSSLGNVYALKALHSSYHKEKTCFFLKSENCFMEVLQNVPDNNVVRLMFSMILFKQSQYDQCLTLLTKDMGIGSKKYEENISETAQMNDNVNKEGTSASMKTSLLQSLEWQTVVQDLITSDYDQSLLPTSFKRNLNLCTTGILGLVSPQVKLLQASFCSKILISLCHHRLRDFEKGLQILDEIERDDDFWRSAYNSDADDYNDRRIIAYLNILAETYLTFGKQAKAEPLLRRSISLMSNPGNAARSMLMSLQMKKVAKTALWKGSYLAVFLLISLAAFKYFPSVRHLYLSIRK